MKGIRITSLFLSVVTVVTMGGCVIKKDQSKENIGIVPLTSVSMSNEENNYKSQINNQNENNDKYIEVNDPTYDELLELLNENTKHLDSNIQKDLEEMLEIAYSNKDSIDQVLPLFGFSTTANILKDKIVEPLKEISFIDVTHSDDEDYYDKISKYGTSCYDEEENGIHIFCDEFNENNLLQILLEEIIHSGQHYDSKKQDLGLSYYYLFGEGEANLLSWMLTYGAINNSPAVFFYDDEDYCKTNVGYGLGNSTYSLCTKYYMYLNTLVGNDAIEEYKKDFNDDFLINKLDNLGIDGEKFFTSMREVIISNAYNTDKEYTKTFVDIEKQFLGLMEKKVNNANTKEEVENLLETYRYLNIQFGYEFIDYTNDGKAIDKTKTKLDKTNIKHSLFEKCKEHEVLSDLWVLPQDKQEDIFNLIIDPARDRENPVYCLGILNSRISYDLKTDTISVFNENCSYTQHLKSQQIISSVTPDSFTEFKFSQGKIM